MPEKLPPFCTYVCIFSLESIFFTFRIGVLGIAPVLCQDFFSDLSVYLLEQGITRQLGSLTLNMDIVSIHSCPVIC